MNMLDKDYAGRIDAGMVVHDNEGNKLGKVATVSSGTFTVEKGFFFPEERTFRMSDIVSIDGNEMRIKTSQSALMDDDLDDNLNASNASYEGLEGRRAASATAAFAGSNMQAGAMSQAGSSMQAGAMSQKNKDDDLVVPVVEDEIVVQKKMRESGQVHVRKEVTTEMRTVQVPVTREELVVERVAVDRDSDRAAGATYAEQDIVVPLMEEEVVISTRPVVREEVHIRKESVADTYEGKANVKKERVEVETKTNVKPVPPGKSSDVSGPSSSR